MSVALTRQRWRGESRRTARRSSRLLDNRSALWLVIIAAFGLLSLTVVVAFAAGIWLIAWFGGFAGALPPPDQLTARTPFQTTPVYASDGSTELYEITDPQGGRRTIVPLSQMPRDLIEATIATEDAGFFSNPGFELRAIFRAGIEDLTHQQVLSGASTITQQVARNVLLTPAERLDRSPRRKVKEIILAYQLDQTYTKNEILSVYLNEVFYGNRSYGVEAAAEGYFGKSVSHIDLAEAAVLAGLPQAPGYYDPFRRLDVVKQRQQYVLGRMVDQGYISERQAQAAAAEPLHFVDQQRAPIAPHFVNYVTDLLGDKFGKDYLYHGGAHAITTLNAPLQDAAERAFDANPTLAASGAKNNAALVALDPRNGHILAMVGSANYDDPDIAGEVNMALVPRPSSGVLSPLTYALALQQGETLASRVKDEPVDLSQSVGADIAKPADGSHQYLGPVTLRQALGLGLDAPALRLIEAVGNQRLIDLVTNSGISDFGPRVQYTSNLVLAGARVTPLEVAQLYAMLGDGGVAHQPITIDRVVDPSGRTLFQSQPGETRALPAGVAYLVTNALADTTVRPRGAASALRLDQNVAVHVTASEDHRDSWAAGYFPNLAVVVWVGSTNGKTLNDPEVAARVWGDFVGLATKAYNVADYVKPPDVVDVSLCQNPGCTSKRIEVVVKGTEKAAEDANAAAIGQLQTGVSNSKTPLVDRSRPPTARVATGAAATDLVTVPDVARTSPEQARTRLTTAGLTNGSQVNYVSGANLPAGSRNVAVGQVVSTSPAAGERVPPGTSVVLTVRRN